MSVDWQNGFEAVLDDRVVGTDTYIRMTPVPKPNEGRLVLEANSKTNYEVIYYTSKDANGVFVTGELGARNEDNNSNGVHPAGAIVRMNITAQDMREIRDHSKTIADKYSALPAGSLVPYAGATIPTLFLLCDGRAVSRTTYASLFSAIGTAWGAGDGSTTFNIPDLRDRTVAGVGSDTDFNQLAKKSGASTVALTSANNGPHTHTGTTSTNGHHDHGYSVPYNTQLTHYGTYARVAWEGTREIGRRTDGSGNHNHSFTTNSSGSGTPFSVVQKTAAVNWVIRT